MFVVDTNILVYAANRHSPRHEPCRKLLQKWRGKIEPWYLTWGIMYEFLRVSTHPNVLEKPFSFDAAWGFLEAVLATPAVGVLRETERHGELVKELTSVVPGISGNLVFDAHTAILMREHGIKRIYTHDADFRHFSFLEIIDPLE